MDNLPIGYSCYFLLLMAKHELLMMCKVVVVDGQFLSTDSKVNWTMVVMVNNDYYYYYNYVNKDWFTGVR